MSDVNIIGGGLAGSEAAWQLAQRGLRVRLSEMRGSGDTTPAHQGDGLAELVCSNSFRSDDDERNAVGLLHHEMRRLDSIVMAAGEKARVPAGSAMAVDRDVFSAEVERARENHPNIEIVRQVCALLDEMRPDPAGPHERLITYVKDRPGHDRRYAIDATRIEADLGWKPAETFDSGIRKTIAWYLANQEWVAAVQSGAYREWLERNYAGREAAGSPN